MLKKRIIPCLDIKDGRTVKGINFIGIRDAGDPVVLARRYVEEGADELVFLDITATIEKRQAMPQWVTLVAREIDIPFSVGGGVNNISDAKRLIEAGADKVCINSAAVREPSLINNMAREFGSQCVVVAIDVNYVHDNWEVFIHGGRKQTGILALDWARMAEDNGAGEILLTSMKHDGTKNGYALEITTEVAKIVDIPVIASGGAGSKEHFRDVFLETRATGALAASIFHFQETSITNIKDYLRSENISVR